jgi:hypothetical protein
MTPGVSSLDQLTFWSEELPAKPLVSQDSGEAWTMRVVNSPLSLSDWLHDYVRAGSFGKTCPVSCLADEDGTLVPSSGRWANSGMGGPTGSWTLNTSEWPNAAAVCSLSDTLETGDVPQRFFLSAKACAGILRRAETRGKKLPTALEQALQQVAAQMSETDKEMSSEL